LLLERVQLLFELLQASLGNRDPRVGLPICAPRGFQLIDSPRQRADRRIDRANIRG